jgi:hypothetical protein
VLGLHLTWEVLGRWISPRRTRTLPRSSPLPAACGLYREHHSSGRFQSLILSSFAVDGPDRQIFDAIGVEDNVHMKMKVAVERAGMEMIAVPAGSFQATRYRVQRFGDTWQWIDTEGTLLRWVSEDGRSRWDLERYPSTSPHAAETATPVAHGRYEVSFMKDGAAAGTLDWTIARTADGEMLLSADERFAERTSHFRGVLDRSHHWVGSSHTVNWHSPPQGIPEVQHFETFFFRGRFHLLRFRDRAYPYLQSRAIQDTPPFHLIHYPVAAVFWLPALRRDTGTPQAIEPLAIIGNFYWGASAEIQPAEATYLGRQQVNLPGGAARGHRFRLTHRGGWHDSELFYQTDDRFVPVQVDVSGFLRYRLVSYTLLDEEGLRRAE